MNSTSPKLPLCQVYARSFYFPTAVEVFTPLFFFRIMGVVYYGVLYYFPIFAQVLQYRRVRKSGFLLLPLIITQTLCETLAGLILAK